MDRQEKEKIGGVAIIVGAILFSHFFSTRSNEKDEEALISPQVVSSVEEKQASEKETEKKAYIVGEINNPGVYTFQEGERLDDLVKKAGDLTADADISSINLAILLEDEMKITIPKKGEPPKEATEPQNPPDTLETTNNNLIETPGETPEETSKININTAGKEELMTLPNIGEKRAEAIMKYRETQPFESPEDIMKVTGIGKKYYESMKDLIDVK